MTSYQKSLLFVWFAFATITMLSCNKKSARSIGETSNPTIQDTPPKNIQYNGYRLELVNISVKEEKGNVLRVIGTIINTGRNKVVLPSKHAQDLVINIDQSLEDAGYIELSESIKARLLKQKLNLEPGQMAYNTSLGVKKVGKSAASTSAEYVSRPSTKEVPTPKPQETSEIEKEEFSEKGNKSVGEEACPDLVIESFSVTKRKKKYAEITYTIVNKGTAPAPLFGEDKAVEDNIAVRAYASGTAKLSRGDMILGGSFIEKGLKAQKGILQPNESYVGTFRVDIRKKTRHMPYLIMFVDTYQGIWECNEGNNVMNITYR